jgi:hypothetical protein
VLVGFLEDLVDVVLVRFQQRADLERRMAAERRDVLACLHGMRIGFGRLVAQPRDDRDPVVSEDHEAVVHVADDARQLELENPVETRDDLLRELGIERRVVHGMSSRLSCLAEMARYGAHGSAAAPGFQTCEWQCEYDASDHACVVECAGSAALRELLD